ncbi:MAG: transposase [Patescibacteria group bacterium]
MKPIDSPNIYHIYNRGVEKRNIFLEEKDYLRFLASLYRFNDTKPTFNFDRLPKLFGVELRTVEPLVKICAFCLMPNHFHLILRALRENGITEFMRKIGTGYTNFFNLKYQRVGPLFQGKYKAKILSNQAHFLYLPYYIHLNPLDLITPNWKNSGIGDIDKTYNFLINYRWSSLPDYLGRKHFPNLTSTELFKGLISADSIKNHLRDLKNADFSTIQDIVFD